MASERVRIRPSERSCARGFLRVRIDRPGQEPERRFAPVAPGLALLAWRDRRDAALSLEPGEGEIEPVGALEGIVLEARRRLTFLRRGVIRYDGWTLVPEGPEPLARSFVRHVRAAERHRWSFAGPLVQRHPELVTGWAQDEAARPAPRSGLKIAVALHLYYTELWPEISLLLRRSGLNFDLFVSLCESGRAAMEPIRADFPSARIRIVDNVGRDIRPFLLSLEDGAFDAYDLVAKIHGKRALGGGRIPIFGDVWRRATFLDLFADASSLSHVLARFEAEPRLGLLGPQRLLSQSTRAHPRDVLGANRPQVEALLRRLGQAPPGDEYDFFEGSMFWARPVALGPLRALGLAASAFENETGRNDGALEHAVERIFNQVVRIAGFHVSDAGVEL